jgi:L-threonylcarbamoyladenylate synthase
LFLRLLRKLARKSNNKTRRAATAEQHTLDDGIAALRSSELIVFPTETFYGLGADALSAEALARLFEVKGRDKDRPVGLIAADTTMAFSVAQEVFPSARRLADAFWPGPLTIVLPHPREGYAAELSGPEGIAIRVSPNPVARALAAGLGHPITATSANLSGDKPASTLNDARASFGEKVKVYLEGGTLTASRPSTVVVVSEDNWQVLRPGAISETEIAAVLAGEILK